MKLQTQWDLSQLGSGINDNEFKIERELMEKKYKAFAQKWKKDKSFLTDEKNLKKALHEYEILSGLGTKELTYIYLMRQVDSSNIDLQKAEKKAEEFFQNLAKEIRFFILEIGVIEAKKQKQFLNSSLLKNYKHFLENTFDQSKYRLSEKEEHILSVKSGVSHGNWQSMLEQFISKETRQVLVPENKKVIKKEQSFAEIQSLIHHKNKRIRDMAATAMHEIVNNNVDIAEKEFNSILENKKINDDLRGYERADHSRILSDDVTFDIVDTMTEVVTDNFKLAKDYYKLKAQLMKVNKLDYHERNVPSGEIKESFNYEKSIELVDQAMTGIDAEFHDIYRDMVDGGRVDVFPAQGKRGGAFCMYWGHADPVYVMLNYTDRVTDVTTLAHEMGHAIHGTLTKKESPINYDTPMFVAEIASNFCEEYVFDLISEKLSDKERLVLNMEKIGSFVSSVQRQVAAYNFEQELHNEFRKEGYLSKEQIGKLFTKHMKSYMGPSVSQDPGSENWWVYWNHFRSPFYVYTYASGLLLANAMRAKVAENPEYIDSVKKFFSTGTSTSPKELFDSIDIDITDPQFWQSGIDEIKELLKETKKLAKKIGKI
jgi:oligoendopeptidase F